MLNDHDRELLKDIERQLQHEDPAWVSQFKDPKPLLPTPHNVLTATAIGLLVLVAVLCLMLGATAAAVISGSAAAIVGQIRRRL